jgi:hypothetical protein
MPVAAANDDDEDGDDSFSEINVGPLFPKSGKMIYHVKFVSVAQH